MPEVLAPLLVAVAVPLVWAGTLWLASWFGWQALARRYATDAPPAGRVRRFASGRIGLSNYTGVLTVAVQPDGLWMGVLWPFRPGHPPLFIPWDEVTEVRERRVLWVRRVELRVGRPHAATVALPPWVADAMREAAGSSGG